MNGPVVLTGGGLWIEFAWQGDRWGHRVGLGSTGEAGPSGAWLLESIEGTPDDDWPPSPALQELHLEERLDGRRLALLVGMAGTSHWSLSVEIDPAQGRALFDVACRVKRTPDKLGSAYRQLTGEPGRLVHTRVEAGVDRTAVPATVRWRYAISFAETGGKPRLMIERDMDGAA